MLRFFITYNLLLLAFLTVSQLNADEATFAKTDWPWWRGINGDGHAAADQDPPTAWSASENVIWRTEVPGRGHGSPTVIGDQIFLATANEKKKSQYVICYDRATGKKLWETTVHEGGAMVKNKKASAASTSPACDGKRLFVSFPNSRGLHTTALDLNGEILWQKKISDYIVHQGYGGSPAIIGELVIVASDNKAGGAIAGLNRETGEFVWRHDRPKEPNYASPVVLKANGKQQLVITGCNLVSSFDPISGKKLWEIKGATTECVTSTVTDGKHVYSSGGYPKNHVAAIVADGSGKVAWENNTRVYVPSMLLKDGYLYAVADAGVAVCWNSSTGEEMWKSRLGGTFKSSPVLVGDKIYATNELGKTFVFKANAEKFESIATSQLGDEVFASPAICNSQIYMRVAENQNGVRQEMLYCLGKK